MLVAAAVFHGALVLAPLVRADPWPYTRKFTNKTTPADEHDDYIPNLFVAWIKGVLETDPSGQIASSFNEGRIPPHVISFHGLEHHIASRHNAKEDLPKVIWDAVPENTTLSPAEEATMLFNHLNFELDPNCIDAKEKYWYRQPDGSCNWLKLGQSNIGSTGQARSRDFKQTSYADGVSKPRDGPNPREVSNAFFKRKERLHYEHTPLMLGLVEFIMHDVSLSEDSTEEWIDVAIPKGDPDYDPYSNGNASFRVWRTQPVQGTGTDEKHPREHVNGATAWLDNSALYGSTPTVVEALRSHVDGKLKSQIGPDGYQYLPYNEAGLPVRTRPGVDVHNLFLGGDIRTNEDWILLSVHTIFLREHNRLCDIMVGQHPDWNDERVYQTVKLVLGAKLALIGNSYQMAYWSDKMPWPRDDGFPLYRALYAESVLQINPVHLYPWPLVTRNDRPMVTSAEMAIVYRFHEFIINSFPIKDAHNKTTQTRDLFNTAFDAKGFMELGADSVVRGMLASDIPNFKSGVDEAFRSAGKYRGTPFDIVTWSIVHEREQGLPTFNQYFSGFAAMTPKPGVAVKYRKTFEDFSSDPAAVKALKQLYKTPDDVDFVVGVQLEEELFPGTTMPISALIPSLFSLFGVGNSDRFSPGYALMRCLLVDKPWNCHPSNALEELLWEARPSADFPNKRWFSDFWMKELDLQAHGTNLLWRLITENSGAKCIAKNPLFPYNPQNNPILCELPVAKSNTPWIIAGGTIAAILIGYLITQAVHFFNKPKTPPTTWGTPVIGVGRELQANPKQFLLDQCLYYGRRTFGIRLIGRLVYYICTVPSDLEVMMNDERRASLHALTADQQLGAIVGRHNFPPDLHATIIRRKLESDAAETLPNLAASVSEAVHKWLDQHPLNTSADISPQIMQLMACVMSRICMGGAPGYDRPELIDAYIGLNADSVAIFSIANLLPSFVARIFADLKVRNNYKQIKKYVVPVVRTRRSRSPGPAVNAQATDLLGFFIDAADTDDHVAELVGGIVVGGLINVAVALTNALYNVAGDESLQRQLHVREDARRFVATGTSNSSWDGLRSATIETLRLSACIIGPVRKVVVGDFKLGSDPSLHIPKNSGLAASPYLMHYDDNNYPSASRFDPDRFRGKNDAKFGSPTFLTFGLPGHTCPGRFFAIEAIAIALNAILSRYQFDLPKPPPPDALYKYSVGTIVMPRAPARLIITRRA